MGGSRSVADRSGLRNQAIPWPSGPIGKYPIADSRNVISPPRASRPHSDYIWARTHKTPPGDAAMFSFRKKVEMPAANEALPGRAAPIPTAKQHFVNGHALKGPYPEGSAM